MFRSSARVKGRVQLIHRVLFGSPCGREPNDDSPVFVGDGQTHAIARDRHANDVASIAQVLCKSPNLLTHLRLSQPKFDLRLGNRNRLDEHAAVHRIRAAVVGNIPLHATDDLSVIHGLPVSNVAQSSIVTCRQQLSLGRVTHNQRIAGIPHARSQLAGHYIPLPNCRLRRRSKRLSIRREGKGPCGSFRLVKRVYPVSRKIPKHDPIATAGHNTPLCVWDLQQDAAADGP